MNIGGDAEVSADHQALALGLVKLVDVVGNSICQSRIGERKMLTVGSQLEPEQEPIEERGARSADEEISLKLWSKSATFHKSDRRWRECILPTKLRIEILRARKHEHSRNCLLRRQRDVARRPAKLLEISGAIRHFNGSEFVDTADRTHRLYPATVEPRSDTIDLIKRVVAVFLSP